MIKKILTIFCATVMTVGMCSGCGPTKEKVSNGEGISLRFSFWEPSTGRETEIALQKIVDEYEKDHSNVHIELVSQAASSYQDWIKAQLAVDDLPEIEFNYCSIKVGQ